MLTRSRESLGEDISPEVKVAKYEMLTYEVRESTQPLVLGDSGVFFDIAADRKHTTFTFPDDTLLAADLPLTPNLVLVGRNAAVQPGVRNLPQTAAMCSLEYFVASQNTAPITELQSLIGQKAVVIQPATLEQLLSEVIA